MHDLRDPTHLGKVLLFNADAARAVFGKDIPLSEVWDVHVQYLPDVSVSAPSNEVAE